VQFVKAAVLRRLGGPPEYGDFDEPAAGESQVVVNMVAAAVHHVELAMASGHFYLGPPRLPSVVGIDGVGRLANGERVFVDTAVPPFGTWAQRALAVEANLLDVADGVEDATAAALGNSGLTAWLALAWRAPVERGQTVRPVRWARSRYKPPGCSEPAASSPPFGKGSPHHRARTRSSR
jgi:NADPH2:quinone reductase